MTTDRWIRLIAGTLVTLSAILSWVYSPYWLLFTLVLGLTWLAGRQGGNKVLTGDSALKPTIGQIGHMNFIHPFRIQILGAHGATPELNFGGARQRAETARLCAGLSGDGVFYAPVI